MKVWFHKKYPAQVFVGSYQGHYKKKYRQRRFVLKSIIGRARSITFESFQMAKSLGWKREE